MDFWRWKGMFSAELTPLSLEAPLVGDPAPAVLCWFPVLSPKRDLQAPQFLEVWASLFLLNRGGILKTHIRPCFRSDKHCCFFSCSRSGKLKKKKREKKAKRNVFVQTFTRMLFAVNYGLQQCCVSFVNRWNHYILVLDGLN